MLELKSVTKKYVTAAGETVALNGISLTIPDRGMVFITGKSGSGKTTLLNVIGGLDGADGGDVVVDGKSFSSFTAADFDSYRNTYVGFVFQEYNLLPEYDVQKNVALAEELQGKKIDRDVTAGLFAEMEIDGLEGRKVSQLSGGQKQRVAIVRALAKSSKIILADELTGALDSKTGEQVLDILKKLSAEKPVVIVSHDLDLAERYADRIIRLVDGKVVEDVTLTEREVVGNVYSDGDGVTVRAGSRLSGEELTALAAAIEAKKNVTFTEKLSVRARTETVQPHAEAKSEEVALINSKMKLRSAASLGLKSVLVKPLRLIITIILSLAAFACCGVFDAIASYDDAAAVTALLREGTYSALPLYGVRNGGDYDGAEIKLSGDFIASVNEKTGYAFRGVYDINDTENLYDFSRKNYNLAHTIAGLDGGLARPIGYSYYVKKVSGIIEFGEDEISGGVIDAGGFDYKIISGEYPKLDGEGLPQVAISSYLADGISFWLKANGTTTFGGKTITERKDLIGAQLNAGGQSFVVSGIIDCGEIPSKYDALKNGENKDLEEDFTTFISAGCNSLLFAPEGYVESYREKNDRATCYYSDYANRTFYAFDGGTRFDTSGFFYRYDEIKNKSVFFSRTKASLDDGEILINVGDLKNEYFRNEFFAASEGQSARFNGAYQVLKNGDPTDANYREERLEPFLALIEEIQSGSDGLTVGAVKKIAVKGYDKSTVECLVEKTYDVVGFYYGVDTEEISAYHYLRLDAPAMTDGDLAALGIELEQGIYSRMITPLYPNRSGEKTIGKAMQVDDGIELRWYKNSVLNLISADRVRVGEFLNLFLYAAIGLTVFSVFLLFNYVSVSISSKRRSIGVLRALGANTKNVFAMFLAESLFISVIIGSLGSLFGFVGCGLVNSYLVERMSFSLPIASFGARQVLIIVAGSLFAGVLSSIVPIVRVAKQKPVELIRRS